jgi:hypothetical protein
MSFCTTSRKSKIKIFIFCYRRAALLGGAIRRPLKYEQFCTVFTLGMGLYSQARVIRLLLEEANGYFRPRPSLTMDLVSPERSRIRQLADAAEGAERSFGGSLEGRAFSEGGHGSVELSSPLPTRSRVDAA